MSKLEQMFGKGWYGILKDYLNSESFIEIGKSLIRDTKRGMEIAPKFPDTFRAFKECPWERLHTVIIGMDPYPGKLPNGNYVADGIAFSSRLSDRCPKSLMYIHRAIETDIFGGGHIDFKTYDLAKWANQGILLLNTALSMDVNKKAGNHIELWRPFIVAVLEAINEKKENIGVVLLGSKAAIYKPLLTNKTFALYKCEHPSAANYHGGNWRHQSVLKAVTDYHKTINNITIDWR